MGLKDLEWREGTHLYDPILIAESLGCIFHVDVEPDANGNYQWWVQSREDAGITEVGGASSSQEEAKVHCWVAKRFLGPIHMPRVIK